MTELVIQRGSVAVPFSRGIFLSSGLVYYLSLTYFSLLSATAVISGRRWRG